jgi:hypothetical protein
MVDGSGGIGEVLHGTFRIIGSKNVREIVHVDPLSVGEPGLISGFTIRFLPGDRRDLQSITNDDISLDVLIRLIVIRVVEEHRIEAGVTILSGEHARVHEKNILVSELDGINCHSLPVTIKVVRFSVEATTAIIHIVMVSGERIEGGKLIPTCANFFLLIISDVNIRVLEETANVSTSVRDTKHVEVHDTGNGVLHILPRSVVVTKPVTGEGT